MAEGFLTEHDHVLHSQSSSVVFWPVVTDRVVTLGLVKFVGAMVVCRSSGSYCRGTGTLQSLTKVLSPFLRIIDLLIRLSMLLWPQMIHCDIGVIVRG